MCVHENKPKDYISLGMQRHRGLYSSTEPAEIASLNTEGGKKEDQSASRAEKKADKRKKTKKVLYPVRKSINVSCHPVS